MKIKQLKVKDWKKQLAKADPQDHLHLRWNTYSDGGDFCRRVRYDKYYKAVIIEQGSRSGRGPTVEKLLQLLDSVPDSTPIYAHWEDNQNAYYVIRQLKGTSVELDGGLEWGPPDPEDEESWEQYGKDIDDGYSEPPTSTTSTLSGYTVDDQGRAHFPQGITEIEAYAFAHKTNVISVKIPDHVTTIGEYAFYGCSGLTSVIIGDSVTNIGRCAFGRCSGLTVVTIPNSVTTIENYAFCECSNLKSIIIPNSVTYIGESAFMFCEELTSVTIPDSVKHIDYDAFRFCPKLVTVEIPADCQIEGSSFDKRVKIIRRGRTPIKESTKVTLTLGQLKRLIKEF